MNHRGAVRDADALRLLKRDHDSLRRLFRDYDRLAAAPCDVERKAELAGRICFAMTHHADIEETLFYPAVQALVGRDTLIDLDAFDHAGARSLIAQIDEMEPGDAAYDSTVAALGVCAIAHMTDEETWMFDRVRQAGLDTAALGREMVHLQRALRSDVTRLGLPEARPGTAVWPPACGFGGSRGAVTPTRRSERS